MSAPWPLEPGERVLWHGRPRGDLAFPMPETIGVWAFALAVGAAGGWVVWVLAKYDGPWAAALAVTLCLVAGVALGYPILDRQARRQSRYAVTDRRALILREGLLPARISVPLDMPEKLRFRPGPPDRIVFGHQSIHGRHDPGGDIAFVRLDDGPAVFDLMLAVARGTPLRPLNTQGKP